MTNSTNHASSSDRRRAVVTGASSDFGADTARHLTRSGWSVLAVARRQDRLDALAAEIGCDVLAADITSADDVARIVRGCRSGACPGQQRRRGPGARNRSRLPIWTTGHGCTTSTCSARCD